VAGLNNSRHDESIEGRKKFENLLKSKHTQTRGTLASPALRCSIADLTNVACYVVTAQDSSRV
jgi:hypothetical protein